MRLTDFMIKDTIKKYKLSKFIRVIVQKYVHEGVTSFLYVSLTTDYHCEIHFTTDGAYEVYEKKRLTTPYIVYIFDRVESVTKACRMLNFLI